MKIRKSRLKEIIKEEVESSKFISINENEEPTIMAPGVGNLGQDAMAVLQQVKQFVDKMIEDNEVYGSLVDSALARLQGIAKFHRELRPHLNEKEPANALLDEIVVQEIVKALAEAGEHERAAAALDRKSEKTPLGHNEKAARDYHRAQAEKEEEGELSEEERA